MIKGGWHRGLRWLAFIFAGITALLILAGAGLWWWAGSPGSLDWTLRQIARSQPLAAVGVEGSLRKGMRIEQLTWEEGGLKVEVFDARLEWQPLALLSGQLRLEQVQAARVRVQDERAATPKTPPQPIALPLRITVDELKVGRVEWIAAGSTVEASQVSAAYRFDGDQHRLRLHELRWGGGLYQAVAVLGAGANMPLDATLQGRFEATVPGSMATLPLSATATLKGPVADLQVRARLQGPAAATAAGPSAAATSATATARITFWAEQPVPEAQASFQRLDLAALWPQAPHTRLLGNVRVQPAGTGTWALTTDLRNELAGPWDGRRLPVQRLEATGQWRAGGQALVQELRASIGGGELRASGRWLGPQGWTMEGSLNNINPADLHSSMAAVPFSGRAGLAGEGDAVSFDLDLKAQPGAGLRRGAGAANDLAAAVARIELRTAQVRGRWMNGLLSLPMVDLRTTDAALEASLEIRPGSRSVRGNASLSAPGLRTRVQGDMAPSSGVGTLRLTSANVASALKWLRQLPAMPAAIRSMDAAGRGELRLDWQGGWRDPAVQAELILPLLELRELPAQTAGTDAPPWIVRDATATVRGKLSSADLAAKGQAQLGQRRVAVDLAARGGRRSLTPLVWEASMNKLNVSASDPALGTGTWAVRLQNTFSLRWSGQSLDAGAGSAVLAAPAGGADARIAWDPVRWQSGELRTAGRLTGVPMAWIELIGGAQLAGLALSGDMVFDGQWDVALGASQRVRASLSRASGDVSLLTPSADGRPTRVAAGVRRAQLTVTGEGDALTATLNWDTERAGTARGRLATRLSSGGVGVGWHWPAGAPLTGELKARLPRISAWSLLAPPGWRLRGSLSADLAISGTRADPQLAGTLAADDLALRSVVDGIELQGGRLRARLDGRRLVISEFVLNGVGEGSSGGALRATGEGSWTQGGVQVSMTAQLDRLRASIRADREVTVSGRLVARHDAKGTNVTGDLTVDRALIELPEESTPKLGDDVVVRGLANAPAGRTTQAAQAAQAAAKPGGRPLAVAIDLNLGDDFRVRGMGIDTRLRGSVLLSGDSLARPRLDGVITAAGGHYRAYGQRLNIERGEIRFTGAIDNPALDILAVRPNMIEKVGVMVTGRALAPYVRLYSDPDMPDVEKLSFMVTGRRSPNGGAEAALVQQAATALLASRAGASKGGIAGVLGLDEVSFNRQGTGGPSVTLGKRFGDDFYAAYEHGMSGALGTLYIFYDLTRRLTLRLAAGDRTAIDLILSFSFDQRGAKQR